MTSVSDVLARATLRTREVRVCLDGRLLGRIDDLGGLLHQAKKRDQLAGESLADEAPALARQLAELEVEAEANVTVFTFQAVSGEKFDDLKRRHPPTEEQWQTYREEAAASPLFARPPEFDIDQVLPRLIGVSVQAVDGEAASWSEDDGLAVWAGLSDGARADLGNTVWQLNNKTSIRPTSGTGTELTPTSGPGSTTPLNGASPTASSPDGL